MRTHLAGTGGRRQSGPHTRWQVPKKTHMERLGINMTALSQFDYELPERLIAYHPLAERRASRLLALREGQSEPLHLQFPNIIGFLNPGDALVINHTRVQKCRLYGRRKDTGGKVSLLLLQPQSENGYNTLIQSRRPLAAGAVIAFDHGITATVHGRLSPSDSVFLVHFSTDITPHLEACILTTRCLPKSRPRACT
jgi:S-adenosylmethionine:tRNA-ribosyltransferase-isomerase (queuine synthetase)